MAFKLDEAGGTAAMKKHASTSPPEVPKRKADPQARVRSAFAAVEALLATYAIGQREMIEAAILAVVARQHCLFIGPPGCNKTGLIEKLVHLLGANLRGEAMRDGVADDAALAAMSFTFKVTLNKYDQPEALLGPISPSALRQDRWERNLKNTIADADFAYIGEVFSANGSTLRSTVRILNERVIDVGGVERPIRLRTVFADTNDQPVDSMLAVYDRFMIRVPVGYTPDNAKPQFTAMMRLPSWDPEESEAMLSLADVDAAHAASRAVRVTPEVIEHLWKLRQTLIIEHRVVLSDRRWVRSLDLLRASAWLRGSPEVESVDFWNVFRFAAWERPADREGVLKVLEGYRVYDSDAREVGVMEEAAKVFADAMAEGTSEEDRISALMVIRGAFAKVKDADRLREARRMMAEVEKKVEEGVQNFYDPAKGKN